MRRKPFYIFLVVITLMSVGGVFLLIHDSEPYVGLPEQETTKGPEPDEKPLAEVFEPEDVSREVVAAEASPLADPDVMPASYREALGIVKGRVVEVDGTPVAAMKVEFFGISALEFFQDAGAFLQDEPPVLSLRTGVTATGEDGRFVFNDLYPRAIYVLGIDLEGARSTSRIVDAVPGPGETVDLGDIVLAPHAVLIGKVVDETGEPVHGARVRATELPPVIFISGIQNYRDGCSLLARWESTTRVFEPPHAFKQFARMLPIPTTSTDHDGRFRLEGVPLGLITTVVDRVSYVTVNKGPVSTAMGGEKDLGEIVMGNGVTLTGKVVDHEGEPAPGIEVRVGPMYGVPEAILLQPSLTTNEEGGFTFPGAPPLPTFAVARRYPEDPWTVVGPFHPGVEQAVLTLPPSFNLRVLVFREDGSTPEDIKLRMRERSPMGDVLTFHPPREPKLRMETSEEGVIDIRDLPTGDYELLVTAKECGVTKDEVSVRGEAMEKHIILKPAYTARVRVLTEKGKSPVSWAEVHAVLGEDAWWFSPTKLSRAKTNGEGLAELSKLGTGLYQVSVSHPKYAVTAGSLEVPAGDELVIFLKPGGIIEGVVHDGGSTHLAPYMIALTLKRSDDGPEAQTPRLTATDHEGRFRVTNLNAGTWDVTVLKRVLDQDPLGLAEVMQLGPLMSTDTEVWTGETSFVEMNLGSKEQGPAGSVYGRVLVNGAAAMGANVSVRARRRLAATVDASGYYKLEDVPAGKHALRLTNLPGPTAQYDFNIRRDINVVEDERVFEDFEILTGTLPGQVIYESGGGAAPGVRITARLTDEDAPYTTRMTTVTGFDGRFLFDGIPIGTYTVQAQERELSCKPVTGVKVMPGGRTSPVVIAMLVPVWVKGRVNLPEGAGESRWLGMIAEPMDGESGAEQWIRLSKDTGQFETNRLTPGSYQARLFGDLPQTYKPMPFNVPQGGVSNLVLTPEPEPPQKKKQKK